MSKRSHKEITRYKRSWFCKAGQGDRSKSALGRLETYARKEESDNGHLGASRPGCRAREMEAVEGSHGANPF